MKPEEINRRIAVLCGWQEYRSEHRDEMRWRGPDGHNWLVTPDYCGDLNACREFEKRMSLKEQNDYAWMIRGLRAGGSDDFQIITTPAEHRCEAFLKMKGQYEE